MNVKQVIVMRKDLNMRKGKMIAQGAHASLKVFLDRGGVNRQESFAGHVASFECDLTDAMETWIRGRFTKVCVSVDSEAALDAVAAAAQAAGLPYAVIVDAGMTEFGGVATKTCLAIGPAEVTAVDAITGALPLL